MEKKEFSSNDKLIAMGALYLNMYMFDLAIDNFQKAGAEETLEICADWFLEKDLFCLASKAIEAAIFCRTILNKN